MTIGEPGDPEIADREERVRPSGAPGPVPAEVDVLIVGCGPAGLNLAAQLSLMRSFGGKSRELAMIRRGRTASRKAPEPDCPE